MQKASTPHGHYMSATSLPYRWSSALAVAKNLSAHVRYVSVFLFLTGDKGCIPYASYLLNSIHVVVVGLPPFFLHLQLHLNAVNTKASTWQQTAKTGNIPSPRRRPPKTPRRMFGTATGRSFIRSVITSRDDTANVSSQFYQDVRMRRWHVPSCFTVCLLTQRSRRQSAPGGDADDARPLRRGRAEQRGPVSQTCRRGWFYSCRERQLVSCRCVTRVEWERSKI